MSLDDLRRYAVARSLFAPTTLPRAVAKLGFVQADPIRAPARAQDLTLRHRVKAYRAGDLERRYPKLALEEAFFVNYGYLGRSDYERMHPRVLSRRWNALTKRRAAAILDFIRERTAAHPREVEAHFALGLVTNYWGGSSNATTHLLGDMHYRGMLRVVRRDAGVRVYAPDQAVRASSDAAAPIDAAAQLDALVDLIVRNYAPLPAASLGGLVSRLRYGVPQWTADLRPALLRAKQRLAHARIEGIDWYWPAHERPSDKRHVAAPQVRLLSPFDPVVWDRRRFELLWGWPYRFEAYTPAAKRKLGYYALPLLWRDQVIGWANASWQNGTLDCQLGWSAKRPSDAAFHRELEAEIERMRSFLSQPTAAQTRVS